MRPHLLLVLILTLLLITCQPSKVVSTPQIPANNTEAPVVTEAPSVATEAPTQPPSHAKESSGLPADAQRVEFQAEDGIDLVGYFYPSAYANAPVVVLMHWAGGDQTDWTMVGLVQWLQNRPVDNPIPPSQTEFYPAMPENHSFAVFTFDFRDYGESQASDQSFTELAKGWLLDAKAAYETAKTQPGVDPTKLGGIGSSIGADAVVDACGNSCQGALSLSPGDFLGVLYTEAVKAYQTGWPGQPIWCVASEGDPSSADTCKGASGDAYQVTIYPGEAHGTVFLMEEPHRDPQIGQLILDWLIATFYPED